MSKRKQLITRKTILALILAVSMVVGYIPFTPIASAEEVNSVTKERCYGADRYDTSIKTADKLKEVLNVERFENIVVACGTNYPDALAGGYLATVKNAPLLIVATTTESKIKSYITANLKSGGTVYLLGGTAAVSENFQKSLDGAGIKTKRLGGQTRYETNIEVLKEARDYRLTERDNLKEEIDIATETVDELDEELPALKQASDDAAKADSDAAAKKKETADALDDANKKLADAGIDAAELKDNVKTAEANVKAAEAKYAKEKTDAANAVKNTLAIKNNVGWYFLNSKAKTSIEYWRSIAQSYSRTKSAANSSTFRAALADATSYSNLVTASQMIDKSNSLAGASRKIDYNLMTASAVSVALYASNHGLEHTFAWNRIDSYYGPWQDENLAYGYNTTRVWGSWYDSERGWNGPHFRNIVNKARTTTGYGYTTKGSPSPSHAQEFGVSGSGAVLTTTAQFRTDLANYRKAADNNYSNAVARQNALKSEPDYLVSAKADLEKATSDLEKIGESLGFDYWAVLEAAEEADADAEVAHKAYEVANKAYADAKAKRDSNQAVIDQKTPLYEKAAKICEDANLKDEDILVCDAFGYADSLSASAASKPILLVGKDLSAEQVRYIQNYDSNNIYVIGGTGAVTDTVKSKLEKTFEGKKVNRVAGKERYATSLEVARTFVDEDSKSVVLTYGYNFPDGLSGGPLAAALGAPMLLATNSATGPAEEYASAAHPNRVIILGGPALISDNAVAKIF